MKNEEGEQTAAELIHQSVSVCVIVRYVRFGRITGYTAWLWSWCSIMCHLGYIQWSGWPQEDLRVSLLSYTVDISGVISSFYSAMAIIRTAADDGDILGTHWLQFCRHCAAIAYILCLQILKRGSAERCIIFWHIDKCFRTVLIYFTEHSVLFYLHTQSINTVFSTYIVQSTTLHNSKHLSVIL